MRILDKTDVLKIHNGLGLCTLLFRFVILLNKKHAKESGCGSIHQSQTESHHHIGHG